MKTLQILKKISLFLTIATFILSVYLLYVNLNEVASIKSTYEYMNTTPETLWGFTGIDVDSKGNFYIGSYNRVSVFDKTGKKQADIVHTIDDTDFAIKVKDDELIIISNENWDNTGEVSNTTFEFKYSIDLDKEEIAFTGRNTYNEEFKQYKEKHNFATNITQKNGATYKYVDYGKVKVTDENGTKIINLDKRWFPFPTRFALIPALFFMVLLIILKKIIHSKNNNKHTQEILSL